MYPVSLFIIFLMSAMPAPVLPAQKTRVQVSAASGAALPLGMAKSIERVKYNNPGLIVDLGVGLWAWPLPMDYDSDGAPASHKQGCFLSRQAVQRNVFLREHCRKASCGERQYKNAGI
ncbi:MAG: hypothetical protein ABIL62_16160 [Planctomycetota bacterium]